MVQGDEPSLLDQIRLQLIRDEEEGCFPKSGEARLDQLASVLDAQLEAELIAVDRGGAAGLDAVQRPEVADVFEQRCSRFR